MISRSLVIGGAAGLLGLIACAHRASNGFRFFPKDPPEGIGEEYARDWVAVEEMIDGMSEAIQKRNHLSTVAECTTRNFDRAEEIYREALRARTLFQRASAEDDEPARDRNLSLIQSLYDDFQDLLRDGEICRRTPSFKRDSFSMV